LAALQKQSAETPTLLKTNFLLFGAKFFCCFFRRAFLMGVPTINGKL
jgi:hypothetical protein